MNEMDQPSYMTTRELANTLGVDVKTIQRTAEKLFDMNVVKSVSSVGFYQKVSSSQGWSVA